MLFAMNGGTFKLGWIGMALAVAACGSSSPSSGGDGGGGGVVVVSTSGSGGATTSGGHQGGSSSGSGDPGAICSAFGSRAPGCCGSTPNCSSDPKTFEAYCQEFESCPNGLPSCFSATDCPTILACAMLHGC
jgi:hypothetical protein